MMVLRLSLLKYESDIRKIKFKKCSQHDFTPQSVPAIVSGRGTSKKSNFHGEMPLLSFKGSL